MAAKTVPPVVADPFANGPGPQERDTQRAASTRWIRLGDMHVTPSAQRKYDRKRAERMADNFDLEALGYPVVNHRDGKWWIVDGQHRVGALRILGFEDDQKIECEAYFGMTEAQEADLFLRRDDRKAVHPLDKFRIAVNAGWETECAINAVVSDLGLHIGYGANRIQAVGTVQRLYADGGPTTLGRTLLILREAYGPPGFTAAIIAGVGLVIRRYGTLINTERVVEALQKKVTNGAAGLDQTANATRKTTGFAKDQCVAAAVVKAINKTRGKKLADWWKDTE